MNEIQLRCKFPKGGGKVEKETKSPTFNLGIFETYGVGQTWKKLGFVRKPILGVEK